MVLHEAWVLGDIGVLPDEVVLEVHDASPIFTMHVNPDILGRQVRRDAEDGHIHTHAHVLDRHQEDEGLLREKPHRDVAVRHPTAAIPATAEVEVVAEVVRPRNRGMEVDGDE
jgi:hypothetical protein